MADGIGETEQRQSLTGKLVSAAIILLALILGIVVVGVTTENPRTDDAEVFANFIGIAPVVEGPLTQLGVADNQAIRRGDLLFAVDDSPYLYALQDAKSQQEALEGQIANERRHIESQTSASLAAQAGVQSAEANTVRASATVRQTEAEVAQMTAELTRAKADAVYASSNLARLEPLLAKHYITADQIDQARTNASTRADIVKQTSAQLTAAQARLEAVKAQEKQANADIKQSSAQLNQSRAAINILAPFTAQREARAAAVRKAQYNYDHCKVYAPFDARVTNLQISEGAYAHVGQQMFTLIDTRNWWVIANFRETQLKHIQPGMKVDVYTMSHSSERLDGVVESLGYGVLPDADVLGRITEGLPDAQRTLNWVHLASRYPVRIRISMPPVGRLRIGESSVVILHESK